MNLNDYSNNIKENNYGLPLGDLTPCITNDGSLSLNNSYYGESFHSSLGAKKEALEKFIIPAEVNRFIVKKKLRVLDLCLGLGYNSACLLERILKTPVNIEWWGIEIDKRPLSTALSSPLFKKNWDPLILEILESINISGEWESHGSKGKVLWGDARRMIPLIPKPCNFDLIFHDAFSPNKCPQLWSEEFLLSLSKTLAPNGRVITYSSSAAIRGSLKRAGLIIKSTNPTYENEKRWSNGTIAILSSMQKGVNYKSKDWSSLSKMEQEHLLTNAGIPFRDPNGNGSTKEILERRAREQQTSDLPSTSSWRKRWKKLLSS